MKRLLLLAAALLTTAPLQAHASPSSTPYGTAVWSTAREYCGLVESGMEPEQAFRSALRTSGDLWRSYTRNDPARFRAAVQAESIRQCVPQAVPSAAQEAATFCPGLSADQITRISNGQRVRVLWPGCDMTFN